MIEHVVLVDENDKELGVMPKLEAHIYGMLHRAFSVFIFDDKGRMLLQRRNLDKYHSGGLWTNSCCSHPRPSEDIKDAALRRLQEEMGMACEIEEVFSFVYKAKFDNGLTEYEFDHVFIGHSNALPHINKEEVEEFKYVTSEELLHDMLGHPKKYTEWFKLCIRDYQDKIFVKKTRNGHTSFK